MDNVHHVVYGIEICVFQFADFGFDVARNGQIQKENRHVVAFFQCALNHAFADEGKLAGGGRNDHVVIVKNIGQFIQQAGFGVDAEFVAQFLRALVCTVGNGNELGIFGGKISGHQFNHFACANKENVQIGNGREDLLCHFDRCRSHGDGVFADSSVSTHFFGNGKGFLKQGV